MLSPLTTTLRPALSLLVVGCMTVGTIPLAHADAGAPATEPGRAAPSQPGPTAAPAPSTAPDTAPMTPTGEPPISSAEPPTEQPSPPPIEDAEPKPTPTEVAPAKPKAEPTTKVPPPKPVGSEDDSEDELQIPQRLPPMQTAGWWTLFAGFAIGTTAGVLAGLAERQEDRAVRLGARYDLETGAQPAYADVRSDYENTLRKGRAEANAAIALAVVGLGAAVAGITLLAVGQVRDRRAKRSLAPQSARHLQLRGGGLQVRF